MNREEENIDLENPDTWQICWFDHEEFDWEEAGYIDEDGTVTGDKMFPDFESFLKIYFYGLYDAYWEEDGEEQPDKKSWCEAYSDSAIDMLDKI